ncbi:MAG: type II secretion system protein [Clostridiales bacterium]|nr:type II secretion system protein [Clostridiales bacterium]MDY5726322.1 type II secretion system protein [Eubacteriales bacterium]
MKKNNKKGFTIVELVIVIAVIAILAAVLIPTFTGVTERAKENAAMQNARNAWTEYMAEYADKAEYKEIFASNPPLTKKITISMSKMVSLKPKR